MDSFRWIAVALSMILGLGVTRLLAAFVAVFRSRSTVQLDWMPLAWAGCIFLWHLQFWWAIIELSGLVEVWTPVSFLILVSLTLLLYVSAALVLPPPESRAREGLLATFERDGRWSLVSLSAYFAMALLADAYFWKTPIVSRSGFLLLALVVLPLVFLRVRSRRVQVALVLVFIPLSLWAALELSPAAYP